MKLSSPSRTRSKPRRLPRLALAAIVLILVAMPCYLLLGKLLVVEEPITSAGATTQGGIAPGTQVLHITTLSDDGPGSLRDAVATKGGRVIVFDIAGLIKLESDLKIAEPNITIAGQTAPDPGITLTGAALRIRARDVIIQHISVRPGPGSTSAENDNRDAISIDGSSKNEKYQSKNVRLENVTAGWSVDEAVSLWFPVTKSVTITNSIVAEALSNAGHPKGAHSMGLLVGYGVTGVEITGNLLVSNAFRNPVLVQGAQAFVANNYVYNPGQNAVHFYPREEKGKTKVAIINNMIKRGPDTKKQIVGILVPKTIILNRQDAIFISGNWVQLGPDGTPISTPPKFLFAKSSPIEASHWTMRETRDVPQMVLRYAGSRPARRNIADTRLIESVRAGSSRIIDKPPALEDIGPVLRKSVVPQDPFTLTEEGETRLAQWLCLQHLEVGGMPSSSCE